ncbi:hypothetical protein ACHAWF_002702, partial [Thalassiosira exigua]
PRRAPASILPIKVRRTPLPRILRQPRVSHPRPVPPALPRTSPPRRAPATALPTDRRNRPLTSLPPLDQASPPRSHLPMLPFIGPQNIQLSRRPSRLQTRRRSSNLLEGVVRYRIRSLPDFGGLRGRQGWFGRTKAF